MADYLTFKKPTRSDYGISALILACVVAVVFMYRGLGSWLVVEQPLPEHIDVLFTFGGESIRDRYTRDLALRHTEATWVLSTYNAAARVRTLDLEEFDSNRVVVTDSLKNTWDELKFLRGFLRKRMAEASAEHVSAEGSAADSSPKTQEPLTVVLVSGPYHMRRIKIAAVRLFNHTPYRLVFVPAPMSLYNHTPSQYRYWWRDKALSSLVRLEFVKTLYYLIRV
jgi:uncharacterized SAM-binding protein YcdF (DUF218 family)